MRNLNGRHGITLISLVVTIIVLIIIAGISINMIINNGILSKTQKASEENEKQVAIEKLNFKITNIQIENYIEKKELPTLQQLANALCDDEEMEYVRLKSQTTASLDKIIVGDATSIFTKLKEYPYEFEINNSLQLASIDGVKVANNTNNLTDEIKEYIDERIDTKLSEYKQGTVTKDSSIKQLDVNYFRYNINSVYIVMSVKLLNDLASGSSVTIGKINQEEAIPNIGMNGIAFYGDRGLVTMVDKFGNITVRNIGTTALTVTATDNASMILRIYYPINL